METSIVALKDTLAVLELAGAIRTPALHKALREAAAQALTDVASTIRGNAPEEACDIAPEEAHGSTQEQEARGPSLYNQFISEMRDTARKYLPQKPGKERFHILAGLWIRHKGLGDLQDIKAAAHADLKAFLPITVPVYSVDVRA